jgi:YYY domain-containing protein
MTSESTHRTRQLWLVALVAFAAVLRLIGIDWDDRHFFHPDERAIAFAIERLSFSPLQLDPDFFAYGSFPFYVNRAVSSLLGLIDPSWGRYAHIIHTGRALSGVLGVLTVLVTYFLGARLYGRQTGLLAGFLLAATPLHIQNSHYITTDVFLTFLVLVTLFCAVRLAQRGWTRDYLFTGIGIGLSVATKFSAMPLLAPFGIACLVRIAVERRFFPIVGKALLALVAVGTAFFAGQPYAILNWERYSHDIEEQSRMVRNAGLFPYTNQYVGTPKYFYELEQMILWGMAPALGFTAVIGTGARILGMLRERSAADLVLLSYVLPFFLVTGWFEVKFPRYLLPIYPILILWASVFLTRAAQSSVVGRVAKWLVVVLTGLAALALMSIYFRPFTEVAASEWTYRHIPQGSKILSQHWDEGFPMPLPGPGRNGSRYEIESLPYYEPDSPAKIRQISKELAEGDYIVFQTKRLYGALTQAAKKFPLSNNYFYLLFAGDLGYELVHSQASRPSLFGFEFPDELADESLTVYDHPKVLIFKNTGRLTADEIYQKVMRGIPSVKLTRDDLLLADHRHEGGLQISGGAAAPPIRSSLGALLWFAIVVQIAGLCAYAVLRHLLPIPGVYALSKVLGVLVLAYLPWQATLLGTRFTHQAMMVSFAALVVAGLLGWRRTAPLPARRADIVATEGLYWFAFALFLLVRAWNPEIYWGEKPMDFSFLNALMRSSDIPPPEPWFSGSTLHYTYFGHYVVAALGKLCNIHPGIVFNLGIGLFAALTAVAAYAAGAAATRRWQGGMLATFLVILAGNLSGLRELIGRTPAIRGDDPTLFEHVAWVLQNAPRTLNFDYFWATSRVIKDTINEYPMWSYLFADLHAHVLVMPFSLTFIALTLALSRRAEEPERPSAVAMFALLGFTLGAIMVTNGWSTPTYVLLLPFVLGTTALGTRGVSRLQWFLSVLIALLVILPAAALIVAEPGAVAEVAQQWGWRARDVYPAIAAAGVGAIVFVIIPAATLLTAAVVGLAYLLYLPFWRHFSSPVRNWGWEHDAFANAWDYLNIFGLFLFVAVPFLYLLWRLRMDPPGGARIGVLRGLAMLLFAAVVIACMALSMPQVSELVPFAAPLEGTLRLALGALALLAFYCAIEPCLTANLRIAAILFAFGFAITAGADVVHVWDRMNTIFKFYIEAWFMFAIASAAALSEIWRRGPRSGWLHRIWRVGLVGLVVLAVFTGVTAIRGVIVTRRVATPRPTLDGTAYLQQRDAHELAAYEWINENVPGIPVIAEAHGPSYQDYTRVSMNTGLPTVLGWDYHVHQRSHRWPDIRRRKADLEKLYTADSKDVVKGVLQRYNVALVYVGGVERRAYSGGNLANFKDWDDLLTPVYTNRGVHVFAVNGQFSGAMPVTTIEEVPQVAEGEELPVQDQEGVLKQPRGLAVDGQGNTYVADFGNDRIQVYDSTMTFVREFGQRGKLPGELNQPSGVAIGSDGNVYVADTWNQRIQVFRPDGEYLREWGGSFYGPRGIGAGPNGEIYLADTGNHKVKKFDLEGKELLVIGQKGSGPGELNEPVGIAVGADGRLYVADNGNARVQVFSPEGGYEREIAVDGLKLEVYSEPNVAVEPDGTIWVTVPTELAIRAYDRDGNVVEEHVGKQPGATFQRPMGVAIDPTNGDVLLTDLEGKVLRLATPPPTAAE